MPTFRRTTTVWNNDEKVATGTTEVTADGQLGYNGTVVKSTEPEIALAFPFADVKGFAFKTAGAAVTLKTNSASTPDDTITLAAGEVFAWMYGDAATFVIAADVTSIFLDNNDANNDAAVEIAVLLDVTP